jgi:hypothetical protein
MSDLLKIDVFEYVVTDRETDCGRAIDSLDCARSLRGHLWST